MSVRFKKQDSINEYPEISLFINPMKNRVQVAVTYDYSFSY